MGPANALKAFAMLGSGAFLPIHWGTFNLAIHPWSEPAEFVYRHASSGTQPLLMPMLGAPVEPLPDAAATPWWRGIASAAPEPLADADAPESLEAVERLMD